MLQPLAAKINILTNETITLMEALNATLDQAAKAFDISPASASAFDAPIAILRAQADSNSEKMRQFLVGTLFIGSAFCVFYGLSAVLSFGFVSRLRARRSSSSVQQLELIRFYPRIAAQPHTSGH